MWWMQLWILTIFLIYPKSKRKYKKKRDNEIFWNCLIPAIKKNFNLVQLQRTKLQLLITKSGFPEECQRFYENRKEVDFVLNFSFLKNLLKENSLTILFYQKFHSFCYIVPSKSLSLDSRHRHENKDLVRSLYFAFFCISNEAIETR